MTICLGVYGCVRVTTRIDIKSDGIRGKIQLVGLVLKIKTGFWGFESEIRDFKCLQCYGEKKFMCMYMSHILRRKYVFARYFEVYKIHFQYILGKNVTFPQMFMFSIVLTKY